MRGCQDFHFQIFTLTDYMHLLGRIDDHSVMLLHVKRTTIVSKKAFSLQAHHVDAPAFQFHRAYQLEQVGIYDYPLAELRPICTLSCRSVTRHCRGISPSLSGDISVLTRRYLRLCSQISPPVAYHAPINSANG